MDSTGKDRGEDTRGGISFLLLRSRNARIRIHTGKRADEGMREQQPGQATVTNRAITRTTGMSLLQEVSRNFGPGTWLLRDTKAGWMGYMDSSQGLLRYHLPETREHQTAIENVQRSEIAFKRVHLGIGYAIEAHHETRTQDDACQVRIGDSRHIQPLVHPRHLRGCSYDHLVIINKGSRDIIQGFERTGPIGVSTERWLQVQGAFCSSFHRISQR